MTAEHADLWRSLPRELAALFRPGLAETATEILHELHTSISDYARPWDPEFDKVITTAVHQAMLQFVDRLADPDAPQPVDMFRRLGHLEVYQGREADALQTAYRIGARVAWRRMAEVGQQARVPLPIMCQLAEAVFAYIDELSSLSIEGYAAARARENGALERRRRRLLELVLAQPRTPPEALDAAAKAARFALPEFVVAVALEPRDDPPTPHLDDHILVDLEGGEPCLLLTDTPTDRAETLSPAVEDALDGWRAAVGPRVRLEDAAQSLRLARLAIDLVRHGVLPDVPVTECGRHLSTVWLLDDVFLAEQLAAERLAPMAGLTDKQRARLSETLLAWLRTRGSVLDTAAVLDVHPQTVRYRLNQLTDLFGDDLDDPDTRFDLEVALRAQRLRTPSRHETEGLRKQRP